jgi:hypothetical protein
MRRSVLENVPEWISGNIPGVYLGTSWELIWEHRFKQAQNVWLSAIRSIIEIILGCILKSILWAYLGACNEVYSPVLLNAP